ncbi:MAG TPA: hypothetical protein VGB38_09700 [bacterium]
MQKSGSNPSVSKAFFPTIKTIFLFSALCAGTLFVHGTSLSIGPLRWVSTLGVRHEWPPVFITGLGILLVFLLACFSLWLALKMILILLATPHRHVRIGVPAVVLLFAAADLLYWFFPKVRTVLTFRPTGWAVPDFIIRCMPDVYTIVLLAPGLLLYAVFIGWVIGWMRVEKNVRIPYTRKIFHFLIFTMAAGLQPAFGLSAVALFGVLVGLTLLYVVLRGKKLPFYEAIARTTDEPHSTFFVTVPLISTALGGIAANIISARFAPIGYLITGWGDAVAEPVGLRWGRHRYKVPGLGGIHVTRSLEGSLSILVVGGLAAYFWCLLTGMEPGLAFRTAFLCASVGTVVEGMSNHGLDNFTIQAAVTAVALWAV